MTASVSANAGNLNLCVYDPSGANGDAFQLMKEYRIAALGWGVDFKLKPYTDEKTAAEDFKAGQCDGVVLTGTRVRSFQKFTGTIEAMGAVPKLRPPSQLGRLSRKSKTGETPEDRGL